MPSAEEHVKMYEYNKNFFDNISGIEKCENWKNVVIYYASLHLIDKIIIDYSESKKAKGELLTDYYEHPDNHSQRKKSLATIYPPDDPIRLSYKALEEESRKCRYWFYEATVDSVERVNKRLKRIAEVALSSPA